MSKKIKISVINDSLGKSISKSLKDEFSVSIQKENDFFEPNNIKNIHKNKRYQHYLIFKKKQKKDKF